MLVFSDRVREILGADLRQYSEVFPLTCAGNSVLGLERHGVRRCTRRERFAGRASLRHRGHSHDSPPCLWCGCPGGSRPVRGRSTERAARDFARFCGMPSIPAFPERRLSDLSFSFAAGYTLCGCTCVNTNTDPNNCGGRGPSMSCYGGPPATYCSNGYCICPPPMFTCCGGDVCASPGTNCPRQCP